MSAFLAPPRAWRQHRDSPSSLAPLPLPRSLSQHPAARSTPASTSHQSLLPEPRSPASTEPPEPGTACPAAAPATHTSVQTSPQDRAAYPGTPQTLMEAAGAARLPSVPAPMAQPSWHGRTPAPRCPFSLESSFSKSDLFHPWFPPDSCSNHPQARDYACQRTRHYLPVPENRLDKTQHKRCPCPMELSPCPARCPVPLGAG